ncbi:hypothetical protein PMI34_04089 [Pseudomonas sp. GM74]|uniref:hypothetical protein n=1 Tax=Pseudomonas sp. GM74 TaxID=1144336 RepID=UPI00027063CB|nr:hypothetical protein [Pseudomonas sp. GM74]EJM85981.1 hypothetical protein PMI34_04089 [Pseudomonas sp. GM74]
MEYRRSIYDRISERRLAAQEAQRLADAIFPSGDFASSCVSIARAWVWLPCGAYDAPLPVSELAGMRTDFSHDPRLLDARGLRRPIRRLATPAAGWPAVEALGRSGEILQGALKKWASTMRDSIDWSNTQVVLFAPDAVGAMDWIDRAVSLWPRELIPLHGFDLQTQAPAQWLPEVLGHSTGPQDLLCLSLDTWVCKEQASSCAPDEIAGEAVSAVLLRRRPKLAGPQTDSAMKLFAPIQLDHPARTAQARTDTQTLERLMATLCEGTAIDPARVSVLIGEGALGDNRLTQLSEYARCFLPGLDLERQVRLNTIGARFGPVTGQWVQIGLSWLVASAEPGCAVWILDRTLSDQTRGWLIG